MIHSLSPVLGNLLLILHVHHPSSNHLVHTKKTHFVPTPPPPGAKKNQSVPKNPPKCTKKPPVCTKKTPSTGLPEWTPTKPICTNKNTVSTKKKNRLASPHMLHLWTVVYQKDNLVASFVLNNPGMSYLGVSSFAPLSTTFRSAIRSVFFGVKNFPLQPFASLLMLPFAFSYHLTPLLKLVHPKLYPNPMPQRQPHSKSNVKQNTESTITCSVTELDF